MNHSKYHHMDSKTCSINQGEMICINSTPKISRVYPNKLNDGENETKQQNAKHKMMTQ